MINERESPRRNAVATKGEIERTSAARTAWSFANPQDIAENRNSKQTDLGAGMQTELHSLRDVLWEAINGIEEKAPGAAIERELTILDSVADRLGNKMCEAESDD
jgi:hypothetical protein